MKHKISMHHVAVICMTIVAFTGCKSHKYLLFANREWHVSDYYGQIIDSDTTYRMTFGNVLIPDPLTIVSSADSVAKYPGMDHFLADILHTARLDSAEILFYAPHMHTMFVVPPKLSTPLKPNSITVNLHEERPYTMWIHDDENEDWRRDPTQMYTNTYFKKNKGLLIIVDRYDYGDTPMAQISIFQTSNKNTSRMNVPEAYHLAFYRQHDLRKFMKDIEFWAHQIESRRVKAIANYKIGQEQMLRKADIYKTNSDNK